MKLIPRLQMLPSVLISTSVLAATDPAAAHYARGTFTLKITGERHDYDLAYTLPEGE